VTATQATYYKDSTLTVCQASEETHQ